MLEKKYMNISSSILRILSFCSLVVHQWHTVSNIITVFASIYIILHYEKLLVLDYIPFHILEISLKPYNFLIAYSYLGNSLTIFISPILF